MNARQRGACWLLLVVLAGRGLDALDLPFERVPVEAQSTSTAPVTDEKGAAGPGDPGGHALPAAPAPATAETAPSPQNPVRINQATPRQLQALPGVGPVLASRIVAFREEHGPFRDPTALRQVKGIGPRLGDRLAPLLRFD